MARRTFVSVAMVLLFTAVCLGGLSLIALNMGLRGPWSNDFALSAEFTTANGLVPQAEVRVSGVHVGTVTAISAAGARCHDGEPEATGARRRKPAARARPDLDEPQHHHAGARR